MDIKKLGNGKYIVNIPTSPTTRKAISEYIELNFDLPYKPVVENLICEYDATHNYIGDCVVVDKRYNIPIEFDLDDYNYEAEYKVYRQINEKTLKDMVRNEIMEIELGGE